MPETDIDLSVGLEVKDAEKTAQQLKKEIENIFESQDGKQPASLTNIEIHMKEGVQQAEKFTETLTELHEELGKIESTRNAYDEVKQNILEVQEQYDLVAKHIEDTKKTLTEGLTINFEDTVYSIKEVDDFLKETDEELKSYSSQGKLLQLMYKNASENGEEFTNDLNGQVVSLQELKRQLDEVKSNEQSLKKFRSELERLKQEAIDSVEFKPFQSDLMGEETTISEIAQFSVDLQKELEQLNNKKQELEKNPELLDSSKLQEINVKISDTETKLDKVNDKLKQQIIHHNEITDKVNKTADTEHKVSNNITKSTDNMKQLKNAADKVRKSASQTSNSFSKMGNNISKVFKNGLRQLLRFGLGIASIYTLINKLRSAIKEGFANLENASNAGKRYKDQIIELKNSTVALKNSLAGAFEPIVTTIIPYIQQLVNWLTIAIDKMSQFIAAVSGQKTYIRAIKQVGDVTEKAGNQAKRALGPLDNLNVLTSPSSGGAGTNSMFEEVAIPDDMFQKLDAIKDRFEELKQMADKIIIEPFKEGFTESVGDWKSKVQEISQDAISIKDSLVDIFTNPELQQANNDFISQTSETLGQVAGAGTRIGLNLGQNIMGGTAQFLEENKDRIALDTADLININTETMDQLGDFAQAIGQISDAIGSESGQGLTASVENLGYTATTEFQKISSKITRDSVELITQPIIDNVDGIQEAIENLNLIATPLIDGMTEAVQQDAESTNQTYDEYIVPVLDDIKEFTSWFTENVLNFWNTDVAPWLQDIATQVSSLWNEHVQPVIDEAKLTIGSAFQFIWDTVLKPVFNTLKPAILFIQTVLWPIIKQVLTNLWDQVRIVFNFIDLTLGGTLRTVRFVFDIIHDIITLDFEGLIEDTMSFINDQKARGQRFIQFFVNFFNEKMESMQKKAETIRDKFTGIIDTIKGKFDEWKSKIQGVIDTINNLASAWKNGGIAGLIGEVADMTSKTSTKSSSSTTSAPGYANGQVIPPSMSKHLAILGDNKHETEVVSPLSTMKEAMIEALATSGVGGGNQEIVLQLDGREFMRAMVKYNNEYKKMHGGQSAYK